MKITFLLPSVDMAGGIRSTLEIANRLQERGHKVTIVYPLIPLANGVKWHNIRASVNRAFLASIKLIHGNRLNWFDLKAKLIRVPTLAESYIPEGDIIVATWWANAYDISRYKANKGKKFYFIRSYEIWGGPEDLVNKTYSLPLHRIVVSSWLKDLIENKFNVSTLGPIPNGINFNLFYKEKDSWECHSQKRIGMVYRTDKGKGIKDGLEAFISAKQKFKDIQLVLFGMNPTPDDSRLIESIDNTEFHHELYKDRLREIYNSLDIFMFPSHYEGFGNPPMEAMACGAACVATTVGAIPDYIINKKTGLLVTPNAPDKLTESLIYLLQHEDIRKAIAQAGYSHIQQFTWNKSVEQLENIFIQTES